MWVGGKHHSGLVKPWGQRLVCSLLCLCPKGAGGGGDGAGEGHMLHVKCARCQWEPGKSGNGCMILGVSAQKKGKKSINNDTPECHRYRRLVELHLMKAHQVGLYMSQQLDAGRLAHGLKRGLVVTWWVTGQGAPGQWHNRATG
jgi:hypothetical protein